jgi:hypothetical protein
MAEYTVGRFPLDYTPEMTPMRLFTAVQLSKSRQDTPGASVKQQNAMYLKLWRLLLSQERQQWADALGLLKQLNAHEDSNISKLILRRLFKLLRGKELREDFIDDVNMSDVHGVEPSKNDGNQPIQDGNPSRHSSVGEKHTRSALIKRGCRYHPYALPSATHSVDEPSMIPHTDPSAGISFDNLAQGLFSFGAGSTSQQQPDNRVVAPTGISFDNLGQDLFSFGAGSTSQQSKRHVVAPNRFDFEFGVDGLNDWWWNHPVLPDPESTTWPLPAFVAPGEYQQPTNALGLYGL